MNDQELLSRIVLDPKVMGGKPVLSAAGVTVESVLNRLAHGPKVLEALAEHEGLGEDDIRACLLFAAKSVETSTPLAGVGPGPPAPRAPVRTAGDLLHSSLVGMWADRTDIGDARAFARRLREQAERRGGAGDVAGH